MKELLYLKDEKIKEFIEKILIIYREIFSDTKKILNEYSIGVAHHKVMLFLSIYEGMSISELLKKLKITKQSLNRVLKDLTYLGIIIFKKDMKDTRIKHVYLTEKGLIIFKEIFSIQKKRIYEAFLRSDSKEVLYFEKVLKKIINE